jgi:hypothetical protein
MTVPFSVSFEFETIAPLTHRGTVQAASAATCFARAVRQAQAALRPVAWTSVVCVLDRAALEEQEQAAGEPSGADGPVEVAS